MSNLDRTRRTLDLRRGDAQRLLISRRATTVEVVSILIGQGNTILAADSYYGNIYGCKNPGTPPTAVPSATPSMTAGGTYADGLCAGQIYQDGATSVVWVAVQVTISGSAVYDTVGTLIEGMPILSRQRIQLPITGGGGAVADVYLPWKLG